MMLAVGSDDVEIADDVEGEPRIRRGVPGGRIAGVVQDLDGDDRHGRQLVRHR
jgi:hypothetical protein